MISVVHSSQMQHTEHKAQRKKRRLSICLEAGFRPPLLRSGILCGILSDVYSDILSVRLSGIGFVSGMWGQWTFASLVWCDNRGHWVAIHI